MDKKKFLKVYIEITNICNLNCSFCSKTSRENRNMTVQEFEHIAREVSKYTNLIALHVKGEPLLHPNLEELLSIASKYNLKVNITTNGILLKKNLSVLLNAKIRQLNISLHSAEQNGLNSKEYLNSIMECVDKLHNNTIISYRLWNLSDLANNQLNREILNLLGQKYCIENMTDKAKSNNYIKLDENVFLNQDLEFEWPDLNKEIISKKGKCYGLRKQIAILSNGDVVPCCLDANADILLGNIFKDSLKNIIESQRAKNIIFGFERGELVEELCQKCDFVKKFSNI
jgi:radical SAM protein with 4Fe4S-binding SPASM domain